MKLSLGIFFIFFVSFLTFLPSFNLALFGDDWLAFFRYLVHLGPIPLENENHLSYFLTPYGPQDIMMGLLRNFFGFNGSYYQMTSFTFRLLAAFSLYPLTFYLTKSRLATLFSILFFAVTTTGIETTSWVFNMPSYISFTFFNIFLFFFLKSREDNKVKLLLPAAITFLLAYIWAPIRMTGAIPFVFLITIFWFLQKRNKKVAKKAIISCLLILGVFLFISLIGKSNGNSNVWTDRFIGGITVGLKFLSTGRFDFLFYPVITFGGMFFPDFIVPLQWLVQSNFQLFSLIFPTFLMFIIFAKIITSLVKVVAIKSIRTIILFNLVWSFAVIFIYSQNSNILSNAVYLFLLTCGGYFLIFVLFLLIKLIHQTSAAEGIFLSLSWTFLSFFFAWWWMPDTIYPSYHRYLTVSALGISILFGMIISLGKEFKNQLFLTIVLSLFLILHISSTNYYLKLMENFHSQQITDKIWSSMPYIPEVGKEPLVFYFEGDSNNYVILHNVLTFGFPPHMQLLYNLAYSDYAPVSMGNWNEVVSAVKDGQSFKAYGYPLKPIPIDHVYAFHLQGSDDLINLTDLARQKLAEEK